MYSYTHRQANDKEVLLTVVKAVSLGIFLYGFFLWERVTLSAISS